MSANMEGLREEIVVWAQEQPEIIALYLYGSQAQGHATPLSDVDVAVLARRDLGRGQLWQTEDQWATEWPGKVDVRVLNLAPLPFRYEVTAHGRRLWAADLEALI